MSEYESMMKVCRNARERNTICWIFKQGQSLAQVAANRGHGATPASVEASVKTIQRRAAKVQA